MSLHLYCFYYHDLHESFAMISIPGSHLSNRVLQCQGSSDSLRTQIPGMSKSDKLSFQVPMLVQSHMLIGYNKAGQEAGDSK